ncbi:toll/interleukin-1 receptor domain-containing protein [Bacillus altitudinis C101]|nr:toll/interleukin-1 receptor domain-containing protein [Bacillus altitudinis]MBR0631785.1 toll/interleukin-1 receptor domain-containing protein [Bacillus altitudinis C101]
MILGVKRSKNMTEKQYDFFISYNHNDERYASWISYLLEEAGYKVFYQNWDFKAGQNFILQMQHGATFANHTLALLSKNYLGSTYTQSEWAAAFASDPTGVNQKFMPVRIEDIDLGGLLPQIIYIDLVGKDEDEAKAAILEGVLIKRKKPMSPPPFPGMIQKSEKLESIQGKWYEKWLDSRIKELENNNFVEEVLEGAKFAVHLVPLESITRNLTLPVNKLNKPMLLEPFFTNGWDNKINKDGYCTFSKWPHAEKYHAYVQFFKNGIIESVDMGILKPRDELKYIPFIKFEKDIIAHAYKYLKAIRSVDIKLPIALNITLFNISDYYVGNIKFPREKINESTLKLPTVIINSWDDKLDTLLKPSYDLIWNHCGFEGSLNYDADGNWHEFNGMYHIY